MFGPALTVALVFAICVLPAVAASNAATLTAETLTAASSEGGSGGWSSLAEPVLIAPTSKDECKNDGWRSFPQFKNQGGCVSSVERQRDA